jgi:hypothetical protein
MNENTIGRAGAVREIAELCCYRGKHNRYKTHFGACCKLQKIGLMINKSLWN